MSEDDWYFRIPDERPQLSLRLGFPAMRCRCLLWPIVALLFFTWPQRSDMNGPNETGYSVCDCRQVVVRSYNPGARHDHNGSSPRDSQTCANAEASSDSTAAPAPNSSGRVLLATSRAGNWPRPSHIF